MKTRKRLAEKIINGIFETIDIMPSLGLEVREAQEDMMLNIIDSFKERNNLLIEAGVGIGKSLSYLIPAILISGYFQKPCIIATGTIQLTEQLIDDIKLAEKILGYKINTVIGKGQSNYPCIRRISEKYPQNFKEYIPLIRTGVDKQNPNGINLKDWDKICVDGCTLSGCKNRNECYYYSIRKKMQTTTFFETYPKIIIVNQDLLISHFLKEESDSRGILDQRIGLLVIDEIHNLEEKTRSALTKEIDLKFIEKTFSEYINVIINTSYNQEAINLVKEIENELTSLLEELFKTLKDEFIKESKEDLERVPIKNSSNVKCEILINKIFKASENLALAITFNNSVREKIERLYNTVIEKLNIIIRFLTVYSGNGEDGLIWGSLNSDYKKIIINIAPKEIDKIVSRLIFKKNIPTIGLSATITTELNEDDPYEYIKNSIGFIGETDEIKKSPFPYENSKLLISSELPNVYERTESYYDKISEFINRIVSNVKGGTLVLFTSKEDLKEVSNRLKELISDNISIYIDNDKKSQKEIIEDLKKTGGIILGTGVFWEGISLKGDLLTCVIIAKLPFPVPDPIIEYKIEQANFEKEKIIIPEMITKLKQGSGRLIRSMSDKGVLVLLDSRMNNKSYKHRELILKALPIKEIITDIDEIKQFFAK